MVTKRKLRELCSKIGSGATPKGGSSVYIDAGISLIRSQNIYDSGFKYDGLAFITDEAAKQLQGVEVKRGDVLLNITGDSIGRCVIVPDDVLPARVNQHVMILRPNANLSSEYLFAYLSLPATKNDLLNYDSGGTRKAFTKAMLENYEVPAPPIETQQEIGQFLYLFNQKIELNRRMNQTLEQLAQALFKQWFVAFDFPISDVDSAQEMLQKKLAPMLLGGGVKFPEIVGLYQGYRSSSGEFVESELGEIPKGWRVDSIYSISNVVYGAPFASRLFNGIKEGLPLIRIRDLKDASPDFYTTEKHPKGTVVEAGNLLVGMDAEFSPTVWTGKQSLMNQRVCLFRPISSEVHELFILHSIKPILEFFERAKVGTTVIHLGKSDIDTFKIVIPPVSILQKFQQVAAPLHQQFLNNAAQSRTLATLRDTLLPQLLSGRLTVRQAAEMVA